MVIKRKQYCIYVLNDKSGPGRRWWMQRGGYSPVDAQINFAVPSLSVLNSYNGDQKQMWNETKQM